MPGAIPLLPTGHRAVELALRDPAGALDARAPRELLEPPERQELREPGVAPEAARERPPGPDAGRIDEERAEQAVDVVRDAERGRTRVAVVRRHQPGARRLDDRVRVRVEERGRGRHGGKLPDVRVSVSGRHFRSARNPARPSGP